MNVIFSKADGNDALMPERDNEKQEGETCKLTTTELIIVCRTFFTNVVYLY